MLIAERVNPSQLRNFVSVSLSIHGGGLLAGRGGYGPGGGGVGAGGGGRSGLWGGCRPQKETIERAL